MTVTRLGQVTAETGSQGEFIKTSGNPVVLESSVVRSGNYSWFLNDGAGVGLSFPAQTGLRFNFGAWVEDLHSGGDIFTLHSSGSLFSNAVRLYGSDSGIEVLVNDIEVHSSSAVSAGFAFSSWNNIGLFYQSGSPGSFSIYINGELYYSHSASLPSGLDYLVTFRNVGIISEFINAYIDDLYIDGLTSDEEDSIPSDKLFLSSLPVNEGDVEFTPIGDTPNWRCVDETAAPDDDTTYVKSLEAGPQDLYVMSPITLPTDYKIRAVIPTAIAKKGDAALPATLTPVIFDGLNTEEGDPQSLSLSYRVAWYRFVAQPDDSGWNESDYASMQYGFKATGTF